MKGNRNWLLDLYREVMYASESSDYSDLYDIKVDYGYCAAAEDYIEYNDGVPVDEGVAMRDDVLKELVRSVNESRGAMPDDGWYVERYDEACELYQRSEMERLRVMIENYKAERERHPFGGSLEFLMRMRGYWLNRILEDGFSMDYHRFMHTDIRLLARYRSEVSYEDGTLFVREWLMDEYAYLRRFFDYVEGRYVLKEKVLLAKHFFGGTARPCLPARDKDMERRMEVLFRFFTNISMLRVVQFDMLNLLSKDGRRLTDIRCFDAEAVMDYVDRLSGFALRDMRYIRAVWAGVLIRYDEVGRVVYGKRGSAFRPTKDKVETFNKRFVCGVIGMFVESGLYKRNWTRMSRALESDETMQKRVVKYMQHRCNDMDFEGDLEGLIRDVMRRV